MAREYAGLTEFLRGRAEPEVTLSFGELDGLVGGLPASARKWPAWWANSRESQPHAWCWLDAGRRATLNLNAGSVRFVVGAETVYTPRDSRSLSSSGPSKRTGTKVRLIATGEVEEAEIQFEWSLAGQAEADHDGRLRFPRLPSSPGIYRFSLFNSADHVDAIYIGESSDLDRRMGNYRNPGPTQPTNQRLNARLREHLAGGGQVEVAVAMRVFLNGELLDSELKATRLLGENLALVQASREGVNVENL